ncbi:MAG: Ldh family oxidoreductase, partial [Pseudomonadota bacterium]|nr:Ldh family oxidoreductase [Pseudomonadota bacterium]
TVAGSRIVAPFGGREARISTAPIAIGVPSADGQHFILDFATSRVAEGKILVSQKTGTKLPFDAMVDSKGEDSDQPVTIYGESATSNVPNPRAGEGAIQTFGQHKGSGLGLACELLAGALTGAGTNAHERPFCNGMLSLVFKAEDFDTENTMQQEVADFIASIRTCPPRQDKEDVLIPGDPERTKRAEVAKNGVNLSQTICDQLKQISISLSVPVPASLG